MMDLVVVGGGIVGLMTAALARKHHPDWTTVVLERDQVGHGATARSAGLSFPIARGPWQSALVRDSQRWYGERPDLPLRRLTLHWVVGAGRVDEFLGRTVGCPPGPATGTELDALYRAYPGLVVGEQDTVFTAREPCFAAQPAVIANLLADELRHTDPSAVQEGVALERAAPAGGVWHIVTGDGRRLAAKRLVLATGPWLAADPELPLRVKKVAALHLAHPSTADAPCVVFWDDGAFLLPLPAEGYTLLSYTSTVWDVAPEPHPRLTVDDVRAGLAVLGRRCPPLTGRPVGGRVFCDAYTPDRTPLLHRTDGLVAVGGCSGSGFRLAPGLAMATVDALER
jgi:glycine/D-amino acid oxidase-like deaminating enzyme